MAVATEPQQLGSLRFVAAVLLGTPSWSSLWPWNLNIFFFFRKICARCALCSPGVSCIKAFALCVCFFYLFIFSLPKTSQRNGREREREEFFSFVFHQTGLISMKAPFPKYFVVLFYLLNVWNFDIPFCLLRSVPELEGIVNASSLCCI